MGLKQLLRKWLPARTAAKKVGATCSICLLLMSIAGIRKAFCQDISAHRFFNLDFQTLSSPSQLLPGSEGFTPSNAYEPTHVIKAELMFPVKMKGQTKVFGELQYNNELVFGTYSPLGMGEGTERMKLHQSSLSFIVSHQFAGGYSLLSKIGVRNSTNDLWVVHRNGLSFCNSVLVQKEQRNGKVGLGAAAGFSERGRLSLLPLLMYKKELRNNWELDLLLPAKMLAVKKLNNSSRLLMGVKGSNANYFLSGPEMMNFSGLGVANFSDGRGTMDLSGLNYRRLTANALIGYEQMLTPLVGLGMEAGASIPLQSGLYQMNGRWEQVHNFGQRIDPYFNIKLFLNVPKF